MLECVPWVPAQKPYVALLCNHDHLPVLTSVALQGASKPPMTDVGAAPPQHKEQQEPLLPSGKRSSPATGFVPDSVLGASSAKDQTRAGDIEHVRALFVPRSLLLAEPCQMMVICRQ